MFATIGTTESIIKHNLGDIKNKATKLKTTVIICLINVAKVVFKVSLRSSTSEEILLVSSPTLFLLKKFNGEDTRLIIGNNNIFREGVTIHRGTIQDKGLTKIGHDNLFMAYVHIAHDCIIGDHVILVNSVALAGHVEIGDYGIVSGLSAVHQFVKIGAHVMIGGGAMVRKDVPPFITAAGEPLAYAGVNSVGLKRRNFSQEDINEIQTLYRTLYQSGMNVSQAVNRIKEQHSNRPLADFILSFIEQSDRGLIRK